MRSGLDELVDEVRLLWHVLNRAGEKLHRGEAVTLGMRAVLEFLSTHGAATVPAIARSRQVSRQHIQGLVNALLRLELVALVDNPAHRRSVLVTATRAGQTAIARMKQREARFLGAIAVGPDAPACRRAAGTLRALRHSLGTRR